MTYTGKLTLSFEVPQPRWKHVNKFQRVTVPFVTDVSGSFGSSRKTLKFTRPREVFSEPESRQRRTREGVLLLTNDVTFLAPEKSDLSSKLKGSNVLTSDLNSATTLTPSHESPELL